MAAARKFWFPTRLTYYALHDNFSFCIWYNDTSLSSESVSNVPAKIIQLKPLRIPLEVQPESQNVRLADFGFTITDAYSIFETYDILNPDYKYETYLEVYRNSTIFWTGILDWENVKKEDYYYDSGIKYKKVSLSFIDILKYYAYQETTLSDIGYSHGMAIGQLLKAIAQNVQLTNANVSDFYEIADTNGTSYSIAPDYTPSGNRLLITQQDSTKNVLTWLYEFALIFGAHFFTRDGYIQFHPRNDYGTTQALSSSDFYTYDVLTDKITYTKFHAENDQYLDSGVMAWERTDGQQIANSLYEITDADVLNWIYIPISFQEWNGVVTFNSVASQLYDSTKDFPSLGIMCGDEIRIETGSGTAVYFKSAVRLASSTHKLLIYPIQSVTSGAQYFINAGAVGSNSIVPTGNYKRFKTALLADLLKNINYTFFINDTEILNVRTDIDTLLDLEKIYTWNSKSYRIKNISYFLDINKADAELKAVA